MTGHELPEDLRPRVVTALERHEGNVRRAASELGLSRARIYRLIETWGLDLATLRRRT